MAPKKAAKNMVTTITQTRPTETQTVVGQQQSLQMVQVMIHGSLSEIFYMRKFFPDYAYEKQHYQLTERVHSYEDFAAGRIHNDPGVAGSETAPLNVLRRNQSKRVDRFFSWLDNGVFPALHDQNLKSLQVYVHPMQDRKKVLETYTFTISYSSEAAGGKRTVSGLEVEAPDGHRFNIGSTVASIVYLFRRIIMIGHGLPQFDDDETGTTHETCISMSLFYKNGKTPSDQPSGFMANPDGPILFAAAQGWETRAEYIPDLQFGSQMAALQIAYLQKECITFDHGVIENTTFTIPSDIEFASKMDPLQAVVKARVWEAAVRNRPSAGIANTEDTATPSTTIADLGSASVLQMHENESVPNTQLSPAVESTMHEPERPLSNQFSESEWLKNLMESRPSEQNDTLNTQYSNVPTMKKTVQAMVQPERMTQGDTQMATVAHTPPPTSASAVLDAVRCQCGSETEDDDMIKCQSCKTLQHLHCYGYVDAEDDRLPEDFQCYKCLLGDTQEQKLGRLRQLVFKRRGMHLAEQYGLTTQVAFVEKMRPGKKPEVSTFQARDIYKYLKHEGYVVQTPNAKTLQFSAIKSGPNFENMLKELRDPFIEIGHKYALPTASKSDALASRALQSPRMPPPMTPASRLPPRSVTSSRTDLDRPRHLQAERTPTRPLSFKRRIEEDTTIVQSLKRHRSNEAQETLSNSQTEFFLATSAMASSPASSTGRF